jgi:hypothetical protein
MKTLLFTVLAVFFLCNSGISQEPEKKEVVVFEKNYSAGHSDWQTIGDTVKKEFDFGFKERMLPLTIRWVIAKDQDGCLNIAYCKIINNPANMASVHIKVTRDITTKCASKWDSPDKRKFKQLIIYVSYNTTKGIKSLSYSGRLVDLAGNGEAYYTDISTTGGQKRVKL